MIPFHLAFPVHDLDQCRDFYRGILGCKEGRSATRWVDFDFFGHQISAHLREPSAEEVVTNAVDGDDVPTRHFGAILPWTEWHKLADRFRQHQWPFRIEPRIRFAGKPGEQGTFFVDDPSGNCLEFKTFRQNSSIFKRS